MNNLLFIVFILDDSVMRKICQIVLECIHSLSLQNTSILYHYKMNPYHVITTCIHSMSLHKYWLHERVTWEIVTPRKPMSTEAVITTCIHTMPLQHTSILWRRNMHPYYVNTTCIHTVSSHMYQMAHPLCSIY